MRFDGNWSHQSTYFHHRFCYSYSPLFFFRAGTSTTRKTAIKFCPFYPATLLALAVSKVAAGGERSFRKKPFSSWQLGSLEGSGRNDVCKSTFPLLCSCFNPSLFLRPFMSTPILFPPRTHSQRMSSDICFPSTKTFPVKVCFQQFFYESLFFFFKFVGGVNSRVSPLALQSTLLFFVGITFFLRWLWLLFSSLASGAEFARLKSAVGGRTKGPFTLCDKTYKLRRHKIKLPLLGPFLSEYCHIV